MFFFSSRFFPRPQAPNRMHILLVATVIKSADKWHFNNEFNKLSLITFFSVSSSLKIADSSSRYRGLLTLSTNIISLRFYLHT